VTGRTLPALAKRAVAVLVLWSWAAGLLMAGEDAGPQATARKLLEESDLPGGLVVHVGCRNGWLTAALYGGPGFLVHGLDRDPGAVEAARRHIRRLGLYGRVSVELWPGGRLPYADGLVNLLVLDHSARVPVEECLRVLAPRGIAWFKRDSDWQKVVKPWREGIDQWTHHLHGPDGNPVAADRVVGPPSQLQWTAGPIWARSHGWTPSVSAMVSAGGRLFYIGDETLACVDGTVPGKWFLVARDAFNGIVLWKRRIPQWGSEAFSGTPETGGGVTVGRFTMPPHVGKRLVATAETVYVTLGPAAPVTALDAAAGQVKRVYHETTRADEILLLDGRLVVSINPAGRPKDAAPAKRVAVLDAHTGQLLWEKGPFAGIRASRGQDPCGRLELAAGDGSVFVLTTEAIHCLELDSGKTRWRIQRPPLPPDAVTRIGFAGMYEYLLTVMLYSDGVVLLAQPEPNIHHTYHTMPGTLYAFDAQDGGLLWKHAYGGWGHCTPPDVFVIDGAVWTHVHVETEYGFVWGKGYKAADPSKVDYRIQALDLDTGELLQEISTREIFNVGHHHRCYRNKSTQRFLLSCRRGVEFVDLAGGENYQDHWVRSGCLLGYLPCNGLLYVTPHACGCYSDALLRGFNALAPAAQESEPTAVELPQRLVRGPVYEKPSTPEPRPSTPDDWPTYRHDGRRSGATEAVVGADLKLAWQAEIDGVPSGLVVADGKVLVAGVDRHTVYALDAETGQRLWMYTAAARIDSPPTYYRGLALFGSADGRVYCLRASDGSLVWRFDAAPRRRWVTAFGQLESTWPVPGSVLVHGGKCWFAAGRSSYLDGGIRVYALKPFTGEVLHSRTICHRDPKTGKMPPTSEAHTMPGLLNDIPATDGRNVFVRQMAVSSPAAARGVHLYTTAGYLDPSWFNRTFWQAGRARTSGPMVLGDEVAYGMELYGSRSRETVFTPGAHQYRLVCLSLRGAGREPTARQRRRQGPKPIWERRLGIRVTALVRAADVLLAAGSPDVVDLKDPHGAWEGRKGGRLAAFSTGGEPLQEYHLPAPPVWDGMAATPGRLFVGTMDRKVLCYAAAGR